METPLKLERERRGLTQHDVADAIGIDRSHYARIEKGQVGASPATAKKLARHFGDAVTPMQILYPSDYLAPSDKEPA